MVQCDHNALHIQVLYISLESKLLTVLDIRDRALFYRHLLLTVSGDKVSSQSLSYSCYFTFYLFYQLTSILSMSSADLASGSASLSQIVEGVTLTFHDTQ